jgi:hypothetical protein
MGHEQRKERKRRERERERERGDSCLNIVCTWEIANCMQESNCAVL